MKFAVAGAGAIGAYLGAMLQRAGEDVFLIARGPHLQAMREHGLRVIARDEEFVTHPVATDDPAEVGPVDAVLLTVKAHSIPDIAPHLAPLLGPETAVVSAQNGIPWWYFQHHGGPYDGTRLEHLDPKGVVSKAIESRRVIGGVVYHATVIEEPGVVRQIEGNRLSLGELDGSKSQILTDIAQAFSNAGLRCRINTRIREELWLKLLGNLAFNPISALTRATLYEIATHPQASQLAREMMGEAKAVASGLGITLRMTIDQRMAGAGRVGHHKTSMLQDLETGRPLELESLVGVVLELGDMLDLAMPHTQAVYACTKLLAQTFKNKS